MIVAKLAVAALAGFMLAGIVLDRCFHHGMRQYMRWSQRRFALHSGTRVIP